MTDEDVGILFCVCLFACVCVYGLTFYLSLSFILSILLLSILCSPYKTGIAQGPWVIAGCLYWELQNNDSPRMDHITTYYSFSYNIILFTFVFPNFSFSTHAAFEMWHTKKQHIIQVPSYLFISYKRIFLIAFGSINVWEAFI